MQIRKSRFITLVVAIVVVNLLLIYTVSGIGTRPEATLNFEDQPRTGDLVFRSGKGVISDWFRRCSVTDPSYSHAGIIYRKGDDIMVVHLQQTSSDGSLKVERLSDFWEVSACKAGSIYRLDLEKEEVDYMMKEIDKDLITGVRFDEHFNLDDDTRMYCSEWIRNKVIHTTHDPAFFPITTADDFRYVAPDNLYLNQHAMLVYKFRN